MKRLFLIICLLSLPTVGFANDGVKLDAKERIINLPQDQGAWYLSIFGESNDPKFQLLKNWIDTHPGLANLKSQVHFNVYRVGDIRFKQYQPSVLSARNSAVCERLTTARRCSSNTLPAAYPSPPSDC